MLTSTTKQGRRIFNPSQSHGIKRMNLSSQKMRIEALGLCGRFCRLGSLVMVACKKCNAFALGFQTRRLVGGVVQHRGLEFRTQACEFGV